MNTTEIGTERLEYCLLCGKPGKPYYSKLTDKLFQAPGEWSFKLCSDPRCRLLWLDPCPTADDVAKAYVSYYTHTDEDSTEAHEIPYVQRIAREIEEAYVLSRYGKKAPRRSTLGNLLCLFPVRRHLVDCDSRFTGDLPLGRVLDVGCGEGRWLLKMRDLGWVVEGVDFDEKAVALAQKKGLRVHHGDLHSAKYPSSSFDCVTLNHVIEHVKNPVETLREARRVLKKGGRVVVFTPNATSLGHRIFGAHWRGLEPPRHLQIFCRNSIELLLKNAGFEQVNVYPQIAKSVVRESVLLKFGERAGIAALARMLSDVFSFGELVLVKIKPSLVDCVGAVAVKTQD